MIGDYETILSHGTLRESISARLLFLIGVFVVGQVEETLDQSTSSEILMMQVEVMHAWVIS